MESHWTGDSKYLEEFAKEVGINERWTESKLANCDKIAVCEEIINKTRGQAKYEFINKETKAILYKVLTAKIYEYCIY